MSKVSRSALSQSEPRTPTAAAASHPSRVASPVSQRKAANEQDASSPVQRLQQMAATSPYVARQRQQLEDMGATTTEPTAEDTTAAGHVAAGHQGGKQVLARFTGADGHAHTIYQEGEPGQERLMVASSPQQLRQVLLDHYQNWWKYYEQKGLLGVLEETGTACETLISQFHVRVNKRNAEWTQKTEAAQQTIANNLPSLSLHLMWDSKEWQVDWIKPSTSNYPPIWAGPKATAAIMQSVLAWYRKHRNETTLKNIRELITEKEWIAWLGDEDQAKLWDSYFYEDSYRAEHMLWPTVSIYYPENGGQLPQGGSTIGLASSNTISNGLKISFNGQTGTTPGGSKINKALEPYGFRSDHEGLDGDHARECQLGGQDVLSNLWPLERAPNRAGGVWLDSALVYDEHGHSMPYPVLAQLVRAGSIGGVSLKINVVADTASERWGWR